MTTIFWPDLLPGDLLAEGFSKQPQSNVVRTTMDAGSNKTRRRYTARTVNYTGTLVFDNPELNLFEQFYHNVLADGVLRFNFTDPITNESAEFRFTDDYIVIANNGLFSVSVQLERLS